ncbi:hypothetical protein NE237_016381 [Protea cynaroides]|uniref:Glycosyltransferase 61 catalytic domain-containing protein n=1 Tax=Protea cynaroides TaxID=273540 RepID=A0A9Q0K6B0_9MAGN|nr:hypothetical protein NE237_016381 [Protea cynaroides]
MTKNVLAETQKNSSKSKKRSSSTSISLYSPKLSLVILVPCVIIFIFLQTHTLIQFVQSSSSSPSSWSFLSKWNNININNCSLELKAMAVKLRNSVTFLPLKDLRYDKTALQGHTWFMSSMYDTHEEGEVQYQHFPSVASEGRLLCILGHDNHDGSWNSYALAWPETLPYNATLLKGLTFISYNHYNYDNIWHGLSAMVPFVAWHRRLGSCRIPNRWILYHWGELRTKMGSWLGHLMEATYGGALNIEGFDGIEGPACFEEAVVMRHNEGGMSRERRMEVYDLMRCKARVYCNVSLVDGDPVVKGKDVAVIIGLTLFMRTGARSFRNDSAVVEIFQGECLKVEGCRFRVAYSNNLSFCDQVSLMSSTDILVSPHGAQLTNMFFMDRNSSVMEFFPKGWLKLAGVGQFVYHWIASWSGMRHRGAWRDPHGDDCPYPEDNRRCFSIYKASKIGHNATFFGEWVRNVLQEVKHSKTEEASSLRSTGCACD